MFSDEVIEKAIDKHWETIKWIKTGKAGVLEATKIILKEIEHGE
jgi:hypothetical protein